MCDCALTRKIFLLRKCMKATLFSLLIKSFFMEYMCACFSSANPFFVQPVNYYTYVQAYVSDTITPCLCVWCECVVGSQMKARHRTKNRVVHQCITVCYTMKESVIIFDMQAQFNVYLSIILILCITSKVLYCLELCLILKVCAGLYLFKQNY